MQKRGKGAKRGKRHAGRNNLGLRFILLFVIVVIVVSSCVFFYNYKFGEVSFSSPVIIGVLDSVTPSYISGWACDTRYPTQQIEVQLYFNVPVGGAYYVGFTIGQTDQASEAAVNFLCGGGLYHRFVYTVPQGVRDYLGDGIHPIYAYGVSGGSNALLTNAPINMYLGPVTWGGDFQISSMAKGSPLYITTSSKFAGAIYSLIWNNKEFLDSADHGRELQSAFSYNAWGENYNPTEAGSNLDASKSTSSSVLLYGNAFGNKLSTAIQMAFWANPLDPSYPNHVNSHYLSQQVVKKDVVIGYKGMDNVIEYNVTLKIPKTESFTYEQLEALTAYMPSSFSSLFTYNPTTKALTSISPTPNSWSWDFLYSVPLIFSTSDGNYAMGIYSPDIPVTSGYGYYGAWNIPSANIVKWSVLFLKLDTINIGSGAEYKFRLFPIVGTLSNVMSSMDQLYSSFLSVNGVCSSTLNTCTSGTFSDSADNSTNYLWQCLGQNGGTSTSCSSAISLIPINATCGALNYTCVNGEQFNYSSNYTHSIWKCIGINGGTNTSCSFRIPVNGMCGGWKDTCEIGTNFSLLANSTHYLWLCLGQFNGSNASCSLTKSVSWLDVVGGGNGSGIVISNPAGINCGATCSYGFVNGTVVVLSVTNNVGSLFTSWQGCDSISSDSNASCSITMASNRTIIANFTLLPGYNDNDGDGIVDSIDQCSNTSIALRNYTNKYGCPMPIATKFDIKPDFYNSNLSSVDSFEIGISDIGRINFRNADINILRLNGGDRFNLDSNINITRGKVLINSTNLQMLNISARITLYNVALNSPQILENGNDCSACDIKSYDGETLVFNVSHFTTYEVIDAEPSECGNGIIEVGEVCDGSNITSSCRARGYSGGTLRCSPNCKYNVSECTASGGNNNNGNNNNNNNGNNGGGNTNSCTDDCVPDNRECSGSGYRVCGNYDSDICTDWSSVTACGSNQQCISGNCVDKNIGGDNGGTVSCNEDCKQRKRIILLSSVGGAIIILIIVISLVVHFLRKKKLMSAVQVAQQNTKSNYPPYYPPTSQYYQGN
jgi:hypothetical protein